MIHAAELDKSDRLKRVMSLLCDGLEHTTRDIIENAHVCAVNSCISEIRANGIPVKCRAISRGLFGYKLSDDVVEIAQGNP